MKYLAGVALFLLAAPSAQAQVINPLAMPADPGDQQVMAEIVPMLLGTPDITRLDAALAKLPRPTPLRGMVQTVRAAILSNNNDMARAVAAAEEALRLLPEDARPKLVASSIFVFSGAPQRAADLWMEASRESPELARATDAYIVAAMASRLQDLGDRLREDRLRARLTEIGFSGNGANERSAAQLARTRLAMGEGREADALASVVAISNPRDLLVLYADRQYAALWPRIAEWAGDDLSAQSRRYLEELRADWVAADDFRTATVYARQLSRLGAYAAVVALFEPMLARPISARDAEAAFLAPVVARALAMLGRDPEGRALLARVRPALPQDEAANALNLNGGMINLALERMDWPQLLVETDTFLGAAQVLGAEVDRSAMLEVRALRTCALSQLGRAAEAERAAAEVSIEAAVLPDPVLDMHICRGDIAAARALVVASLHNERTRTWALRFAQPARLETRSPFQRLKSAREKQVREAADVVAAANRVGRILAMPIEADLPPGFDPYRVLPPAKPVAPDSI